jgi:hypothetical protein
MVETYLLYQKDKSSNASVNGRLISYTRRINLVMPLSMLETYLLHRKPIPAFEMYEIKKRKWHNLAEMPTARASSAAAIIGNKIVVIGLETYLLHQKDKPSNASVNGRDLPLIPEG